MKRKLRLLLAGVLFLVGFLLVERVPVGVDAAAVATTTSTTAVTDKLRCAITYSGTTPSITMRGRCYFDSSRSGWVSLAGTDINAPWNASPLFILLPKGGACTVPGTGTPIHVDVGPQSGAGASSGVPIPSQAFEFTMSSVSGASCAADLAAMSGAANSARLKYTASTNPDQGQCMTGSCVASSSASWPAWPTDWFPGGSSAVTFCGGDVLAYYTDDIAKTPIPATDRVWGTRSITFETSWTSGRTSYVKVWFPDKDETGKYVRFGTSRSLFVSGGISNPAVVVMDRPPVHPSYMLQGGMLWSNVTFECYDDDVDVTSYMSGGQTAVESGDGRAERPCELVRVIWPAQRDVASGESVTFHFSYSGLLSADVADTTLDLSYATIDEEADMPLTSSATWVAAETWTAIETDAALSYNSDETLTADYDGSMRQFVLRCTDEDGDYFRGEFNTAIQVSGDEPASSEGSCLAQSGIGLSPRSWVPGLVRMTSCILQWLFIPSSGSVSALYSVAEELTTQAPFAYVVAGIDLVQDTFAGAGASITSHTGDCLEFFSAMPTFDGDPIFDDDAEACSTVAASGSLTTTRNMLGVLFWVGAIWMLVLATRKVIVAT